MKRILFIALFCAALVGVAQANHRSDAQVSFGFFYSSLSPYGEWIETDPGFYVWRPYDVRDGWRPYLHGRWAWSSYGWYWVSYEPFGWIAFHYGRWYFDDFYGWVWVPDYVWGPAWVEWRYNDDHIGWAPLPPYATFSINIGIRFTRVWAAPYHYWTFVPCRSIVHHRLADHVVPIERTRRFFGSTRSSTRYGVDNGRVVNRGVDIRFVERRAKTRIERLEIVETRERGVERITRDNGQEKIEVYRPSREEVKKIAPSRIEARRSERKLSLDRENLEKERDIRSGGRENVDGQEPQTRKEREIYRAPQIQKEREVRPAPEQERRREPQIQKEREVRRAPEQERKREPQIQKEREVRREPEQERRREPRIETEKRDTKKRPESPTREKERASTPPRSDRKR